MTTIDDVLEHFGVRGMHWGVRKDRKEPATPVTTSSGGTPLAFRKRGKEGPAEPIIVEARAGQPIRTKGGKGHPVKDEAIVAAVLRQRAKASGRQSLSNQDLQIVINRMNLEQSYSKLNPKKLSFGQKATEEILYGSTPKIALEGVKALGSTDPRVKKGTAIAEAIISNRPKKPAKK